MTKYETTILKGIAIVLMLTHHLFADSATLEMMNVQCMFPEEIFY